jgi:hypothetical protein
LLVYSPAGCPPAKELALVDLRKLFKREEIEDPRTRVSGSPDAAALESELRSIVLDQVDRGGIPSSCLTVEVRSIGHGPDGREVYQAMMRVTTWQPSVTRLLLGLPLLQAKVRRMIRGSWLHDVCHFHGLWLHPSGQLEETEVMKQLRDAITLLEQSSAARPIEGEVPQQSIWSLPPELERGEGQGS